MTVSAMPEDMVVLAHSMDRFSIEAHRSRIAAMIDLLEERRDAPTRTTGLDLRYAKPRHTTSFGDPSVIVESSQTRDMRDNPMRSVRAFGSEHLYRADYEECETSDPFDVLRHSDVGDAIALARRFHDMVARAWPARERDRHTGDHILLRGLVAYLTHEGIDPPRGEVSLWTGRPYGLPEAKTRNGNGDFEPIEGVDPVALDAWLPPAALFQEGHVSKFGPAALKVDGRSVDWRMDSMDVLRHMKARDERCSG